MSDESDSSGSESTVYDVERILAQDEFDGEMLYLVKWQGYGEEQCTWEPPENFSDPQTLREWEKRLEIGDTLDDETISALQERMNEYQDAQKEQEEQRRLTVSKRRRLVKGHNPTVCSASESDTPMISKRPKLNANSTPNSTLTRSAKPKATSTTPANPTALPSSAKPATLSNNTQQKVPAHREKDKITATSSETRKASTVASALGVKGKYDNHKSVVRRPSESRAGERFKSLRHQNNYAKAASREGVPDISRTGLKSPEELTQQRAVAAPLSPLARTTGDSWLFVPEDGRAGVASPIQIANSPIEQLVCPEIETSTHPQGEQGIHARTSARQRLSQEQGVRSRRPSQIDKKDFQTDAHSPSWGPGPYENASSPAPVDQILAQLDPTKGLQFSHPAVQVARKDSLLPTLHPVYPSPRKQSDSSVSTNTEPKTMKSVITTRSGRLFDKGAELLVYLSLGGHPVGDVKFLHLPYWLRTKFKGIKPPGEALLRIEFHQHDVRNWAEYSILAKEFSGPPCALGEIEAYEDTQQRADSLAEYLEGQSVCAVWVYPDPLETLVMILYSQAAPEWSRLGNNMTTPVYTQRLRLLICNTRTPLYSAQPQHDQAVLRRNSSNPANIVTPSTTGVEEGSLEAGLASGRGRLLKDADGSLAQNLETKQHCIRGDTAKLDVTERAGTGEMMYERHSLSTNVFQYLTTVSSRLKADPSNARIFIAFANLFPYEARVLREWLSGLVKARNIFSDTEKDGWEEFLESSEKKVGVVLFHQKLPNFTSLKELSVRLQGDTLVCFNISSDDKTERFLFERIFPRGTAVCITEYCMTEFLEPTLEILRWFEFTTKQKKSNWKLVLFPDAVNKCMQRLRTLNEGPQKTLAEIVGILLRLTKPIVRSPMDPDLYICGENFDGEGGSNDSLVLSPPPQLLNLSTYARSGIFCTDDERVLKARGQKFSEYVRAWTVLNCMNYRRFFVIDDSMTSETEPHSCHIQFRHPESFMKENRFKVPLLKEN